MEICRLSIDISLFWRICPILLSYSPLPPPHCSKLPQSLIHWTNSIPVWGYKWTGEGAYGRACPLRTLSEFSVDSQELWGAWRPFSQITSFLLSESMQSCRRRSPAMRDWSFNQGIQCISLTIRTMHAAERQTSPATASHSLEMSPDDLGGPGSQMQDPN